MSVAERLYYADSFLQTFPATVTDVRELSRTHGESIWQLALDRTAFYPASGGQPFDTGTLRATSRGGAALEIPVESVEEDESGEVWHFVRKPVAAGTPVEGAIQWQRRLDHMQQHTGQHLLSAVFLRELNAPTVSFHLGETASTIDLAGGPIAQHSLERVERLVNEIIAEDRSISIHYASRNEAEAMLAAGVLRKMPEREGRIRLVDIDECDRNACGGTHLRSTGQIGGMLLRNVEKVTRGTRVSFVCGQRAVTAAREDAGILAKLTAALSVGVAEMPAAVERLKAESKAGAKERQRLREDLAAYHAARLAVEVPIQQGLRLIERSWKDRDREYIRLLALRVATAAPSTAAVFCAEDADPVRVYLAASADLEVDCGSTMKAALASMGLRGGGSSDLAQCDVPAKDAAPLRAALAGTIRAKVVSSRAAISERSADALSEKMT